MPKFKAKRRLISYEDVEVIARDYDEASELIEDDDISVDILKEFGTDYEIIDLEEVKE